MSQENVEAVRRAVEAWNADDLDAFLAELDADVEWQPGGTGGVSPKAEDNTPSVDIPRPAVDRVTT